MKSAPASSSASTTTDAKNEEDLDSAAGKRESIRLEGIHRYDRGLFVLDLDHGTYWNATTVNGMFDGKRNK